MTCPEEGQFGSPAACTRKGRGHGGESTNILESETWCNNNHRASAKPPAERRAGCLLLRSPLELFLRGRITPRRTSTSRGPRSGGKTLVSFWEGGS